MVTEEVFTLQVQVEANRTAWAALVVHEENLDVEFKVSGTRSSSRSVVKVKVNKSRSFIQ